MLRSRPPVGSAPTAAPASEGAKWLQREAGHVHGSLPPGATAAAGRGKQRAKPPAGIPRGAVSRVPAPASAAVFCNPPSKYSALPSLGFRDLLCFPRCQPRALLGATRSPEAGRFVNLQKTNKQTQVWHCKHQLQGGGPRSTPKQAAVPQGCCRMGPPSTFPPGTRCPRLGCAGAGRGAAARERWHEPKCPLCSGRHRSRSF